MPGKLTQDEISQLMQTIDMFKVIVESQPDDTGSLEILKEAYYKLDRRAEVVEIAKRIAKVYATSGQFSQAILEYESILELNPSDPDVHAALSSIIDQSGSLGGRPVVPEPEAAPKPRPEAGRLESPTAARLADSGDDGRVSMRQHFVEAKLMGPEEFDKHWVECLPKEKPAEAQPIFIEHLAEADIVKLDESMRLLCDKAKLCYLPVDHYDIDMEWARSFPRFTCLKWGVVPFDRMSKSAVMVATANPWNKQAAKEIEQAAINNHCPKPKLIWYLSTPKEIKTALKKVFRS
jgi:tetratricopeptide (TPR) repeat protein